MNTAIPLTLLLMGLTGGLHCAAMCGGLVLASERAQAAPPSQQVLWPARRLFWNQLQLQGARVVSYGILGAIAGWIGAGVWAASARPVQLVLYGLGSLLLLGIGLAMTLPWIAPGVSARFGRAWPLTGWIARGVSWVVQPALSRLLPFDTVRKRVSAGLLWGLMPCGLVYSALSLAFLTAEPWEGALAMLAFGLGTLPHMLLAGHTLRWVSQHTNRRAFHLVAGLLLLAYGGWGAWKLLHAGTALPLDGGLCVTL